MLSSVERAGAVRRRNRVIWASIVVSMLGVAGCAGADQALEPRRPPREPESRPPAPPPVVVSEPPAPRLAPGRAEKITEAFVVEYPAGAEADAEKAAEWTFGAIAALTEFTGLSWRDVVGEGAVRVRLASSDENRKRPGETEIRSKFTGGALAAEIELLAPSAHRRAGRDAVGDSYGDTYFRRLLTRQVGVLYAHKLRRLKPGGYSFDAAPRWFQQGVAEWFGVELGSDDSAAMWAMYAGAGGSVTATPSGLKVSNDAIDGALVMHFLAKEAGRERVRALLIAPEHDFYEALSATTGLSAEELASRYRR